MVQDEGECKDLVLVVASAPTQAAAAPTVDGAPLTVISSRVIDVTPPLLAMGEHASEGCKEEEEEVEVNEVPKESGRTEFLTGASLFSPPLVAGDNEDNVEEGNNDPPPPMLLQAHPAVPRATNPLPPHLRRNYYGILESEVVNVGAAYLARAHVTNYGQRLVYVGPDGMPIDRLSPAANRAARRRAQRERRSLINEYRARGISFRYYRNIQGRLAVAPILPS